jgi:hypothetical protein
MVLCRVENVESSITQSLVEKGSDLVKKRAFPGGIRLLRDDRQKVV